MPNMGMSFQETGPASYGYVLSYMLHPADEKKRQLFNWVQLTEIQLATQDGDQLQASREQMTALIEAAKTGAVSFAGKHPCIPGMMAGHVLESVLTLVANDVPDAGLDKAQHMTASLFSAVTATDGTTFKASRETVAKSWTEFRTVSHLWAAYNHVWHEYESSFNREAVIDMQAAGEYMVSQGDRIVSVAHSLLQVAEKTKLPRTDKPLLSTLDAWVMPGVKTASLTAPALTAHQMDWLSKFEPRYRGDH